MTGSFSMVITNPEKFSLRRNLMAKLRLEDEVFPGIIGYQDTVIPQLENAILSGHDIILLGERGQAKSRIIRGLTSLLDEYTPILADVEIPENPLAPVTAQGRKLLEEMGDDAPIRWLHRDERYGEKLATPDITIADLIGEVDPIKIAEGRYLSDEEALHFGLIPHTNRGIFAINELPDLAERIQVGLLNVMEERDIQIRGHKVRLNLDVLIVATANPEDYTNRGRIITPLKDRYGSQIRTHYPATILEEIAIMEQEQRRLDLGEYRETVPVHPALPFHASVPWLLAGQFLRCRKSRSACRLGSGNPFPWPAWPVRPPVQDHQTCQTSAPATAVAAPATWN